MVKYMRLRLADWISLYGRCNAEQSILHSISMLLLYPVYLVLSSLILKCIFLNTNRNLHRTKTIAY